MTHFDIIKAAVVKAVPEITELKFGCRAKDFLRGEFVVAGVQQYEGETDTYFQFYDKIPHPQFYQSPRGNWDIIGRPIRLADVLLAQNEKLPFLGAGRGYVGKMADTVLIWNLSKDDLSQQSESCLAFLAGILQNV